MIRGSDAWYDAAADRAGLTRRQLLVWAGDRIAAGAPVFVEAARWLCDGPLDPRRLVRAFAATVAAADALRLRIGEIDGWPAWSAPSAPPPELEVVDLSMDASPSDALDDLGKTLIAACASGTSLVAATLARLGPDRHALVLAQHQLVSDSWSFGLLHRRLEERYAAPAGAGDDETAPGWPQFAQYVAFERAYRQSPAAAAARRYWERTRAGVHPAGESPPSGASATRVRRIVVPLGRMRSAAVRRAAQAAAAGDVGLFVFFGAVVAAHLQRTAGADDIVLDVPFANRPSAHFKETLGTFMNVCPVRIAIAGDDRVSEVRSRLAAATFAAARHQMFTGRGGGVPQAYDVLVNVHRPAVAAARFGDCALRVEWVPPTHRFGAAAVAVHDFGATGALTLAVDLNEGTFSPGDRAAFAASLLRIVDEHLDNAERRLAAPDRIAGAVTGGVSGSLATAAAPSASGDGAATVWSRFAAQARVAPDAVAVRCGAEVLTYAELAAGAAAAARRLAAAGARRGEVIALWGARGPRWLCALLGTMAAGAAYLPIDPSWPVARVGEVLRRSRTRLFVTDGAPPDLPRQAAAAVTEAAWTAMTIADAATTTADGRKLGAELCGRAAPATADAAATAPSPPPSAGPEAGDVAYLFYTSGSTGAPKGVLIEHAGLLNHLEAKIALLGLAPGDRVAQNAAAGFDISLWQCLAPLLVGAEVAILPDAVARDPGVLVRIVAEQQVTVLEVVPSVLRLVLDAEQEAAGDAGSGDLLASLRFLLVTGEALPPGLCRRWFALHPATPLVNAYGPTECADDVTHHVLRVAPPANAPSVPIGRPIPGMEIHLLDAALQPVGDGDAGELCVSGVGVARGYMDDPERTAAAFVTCPLGPGGTAVRVYRTGDRGRRLSDGSFVWLGRLDAQVKIRGVRVEPAEVEAVLAAHPEVRQAAMVTRAGDEEEPRLVAHVVLAAVDAADTADTAADAAHEAGAVEPDAMPRRHQAFDRREVPPPSARIAALRAFVQEHLPEAMVPAAFVVRREMPLTVNGKIDREALAAGDDERRRRAVATPPASPLEHTVAAIWSRLLGVAAIGRDEDFFALGGDSLLAYRLLGMLRAELGVELALEEFLAHPTVAGAAAALAAVALDDLDAAAAEALLAGVEALGDDGAAVLLRGDTTVEEIKDV
ncbi:MAG: hypothetical protein B6D46_07855 [Polyangiaceae bacterium UTPRO1]|jgi:amino acid adenylation domain-containing protein|nr:amino acid adenylation domain-containing protein [Myxococcales bacterium]OQY67120.1 MAG: hypothetical protein B6D46_07855 [Polyangiaceae bacterium UTPRO1]